MVSQSSILVELRRHTGPARSDYVPSPEYKEAEAFLGALGIPLDRPDALGMARALLTVRFDESQPEHIRERASRLANVVRWEVPSILKTERRERRGRVVQQSADPLGYDTSNFMAYARQVAQDALAGKNEDAVQAELARVSRLFPAADERHPADRTWLARERVRDALGKAQSAGQERRVDALHDILQHLDDDTAQAVLDDGLLEKLKDDQ